MVLFIAENWLFICLVSLMISVVFYFLQYRTKLDSRATIFGVIGSIFLVLVIVSPFVGMDCKERIKASNELELKQNAEILADNGYQVYYNNKPVTSNCLSEKGIVVVHIDIKNKSIFTK